MTKKHDQMAPPRGYATGSAKVPKHIRDMLENQQQQIEQLTGLLKAMSGVGGPDPTVAELCDKWEVSSTREGGSRTSAVSRLGTIKRAVSHEWPGAFGDLRLSQLTPLHFEAYQRLRANRVSHSAVRAEAVLLRAVMNWATKKRVIKANPFTGAEMLYEIRTRETVYTPMQVYGVYNWLVNRSAEVRHAYPGSAEKYLDAAATVLAIASTGIRPDELCGMQIQQLSRTSTEAEITKEQSKGGYSARRIRFDPEAHAALLARAGERTKGPVLLTSYRQIADRWREACDAMGIKPADGDPKPDMYSLRHTFGTAASEVTKGDVFALMRAMGHAKITTTQRYVKVSFERAATAFEAVHSYLSGNGGEAQDT